MRTGRRVICLTLSCLTLITGSLPAHAAATLSENGEIAAPKSDVREIVADNAALVAEVEAVRRALQSERKSTQQLIDELNAYMAASGEEKTLLREQNQILKDTARAERERSFGRLLLGLVIGGVIGGVAAN